MIARFRLLALPMLAHSTLAVALLTVMNGSSVATAVEFDAPALEFFEKQVRPILAQRCLECHSGKLEEPKGGLRLDSREATLKGGDTAAAIVPGKPHESLLIGAINWGDDYQMPPKSKMPAEEIAVLTKWVEMGAPWPKEAPPSTDKASKVFNLAERKASHWCWQPIVQPAIPNVKQGAWVKSPIDAFILAKLEEKGLAPNPAADKRVLIRRAYFDLIGLPPTPEQVHAFVQDNSPEAFAKVVDGLLKSPQFGERWGRHWLDLMRYGESRGHEFDPDIPNVWHYRDYVIRALNADVPYDQFVTEHIAGDLLAQPRKNPEEGYNESILGTGFWFLGEWIHSPVDIRKDECDRFDNMVDTFSKTFLGLTVSCARCHDHKFDAISQKDYYALFGYLQSSDYRQARFDTEQSHREIAAQLQTLDRSFLDKEVMPLLAKSQNDAKTVANDLLAAREAIQAGASSKNAAPLEAIAKARGTDIVRLQAWVTYLEQAKDNPRDLLHTWAKLAYDPQAAAPNRITDLLRPAREAADKRTEALQAAWQNATLVADYTRDTPLNADGPAFIKVPAGQAIFAWKREQPLLAATELYGSVRRDYRWSQLAVSPGVGNDIGAIGGWNRSGNSFRTPTFEVRKGPVAYLVKGGGRAFAAIDSHRLVQGPLHGQAVKEWNDAPTDEPRWITQNLEAYAGHRIHLEFTPKGEEELQVLMVVAGPPPAEPLPKVEDLLPLSVNAEQQASLEAFASAVAQLATGESKETRYAGLVAQWRQQHADLLATAAAKTLPDQLKSLADRYHTEREKLFANIKWQSRTAPAMWDGFGDDERLLIRGNATTPRDLVPRRFLSALAGESAKEYPHGSGRLDLAQQVLAENNPLTARVMANRVWHHLLGRGIVPSVDNFGVLGQPPSHPELLDHLAVEFRREGWSLKRLIRSVMLSNTYQMASTPGEADKELDPQNLLLHRGNIRRLEAEVIRDQMLALSGRLNSKQFGPSVHVFLTPYMQGRGRPAGGPLDGDGRRSIYIAVRRNFLSPMMLAFDTPNPSATMGRRNVSNVPAQALTLMNDPFVVEQAKLWANKLLADPTMKSPEERIARLYQEAYSRAPTVEETTEALAFITSQGHEYGLPPAAAQQDARPWSDLCHVIMNVKEFIFIP